MTLQAYLALLGWIPAVVLIFTLMPARRAAAAAVIGAWLLLPPYGIAIAGLPDYSKSMAASLGVFLGTMIFGTDRILSFRPRWYDLPMVGFCLCGIASSLQNGLGLYDGLSDALSSCLTLGLPYLVGRLYFGDPEGLRSFAAGMIVGGLGYVPLCLYEIRMSPLLLQRIYGYVGGLGVTLGLRFGGYRPKVFFNTGLECSLWMMAATLAAWWLWRCGAIKKIGSYNLGRPLLPILVVTTILCKSTGAVALMGIGMLLLWLSVRFKTRLLLVVLLLLGPAYVAVRTTHLWSGQQAVDLAKATVGADRAKSLAFRFECEDLLVGKAMQQPVFGWGGWARSSVLWEEDNEYNKSTVVTDGLWIIYLGTKGLVGLTLYYLAMGLPALLFIRRFPPELWGDPRLAAGSLAAVFLGLYMIDCLLNAFPNIIYFTLAGGLMGLDRAQFRAAAGPRPEIKAAGRRAGAAAGATPASGRLALADRCRSLGRSFKQEGRPDEADAAWRQALEVLGALLEAAPHDDGLRRRWCDCANDLAWLRANHPDPARRDPISAAAMALRAADEYPDTAAYWNTLGVAHHRAGDDRAAVVALERGRALGGGTAFDDVFLAMAHARLGDMATARQELARAMLRAERDHPGHPELAGFCDEAHSLIKGAAATADAR